MKKLNFPLLIALTIVCGCSSEHFMRGKGDVGQFILSEAATHGGISTTTNTLLHITDNWRYSRDTNGVIIRLSREEYPLVEAFLFKVYGKPRFGPTDTVDGGKLGGYRLSPKGGAIQFAQDTNFTQVIILRPITGDEMNKAIPQAFKQ